MTRAPLFAWVCLIVWAVWLFALQGSLAASSLARWTPDLGVVLLLALTARLTTARARWAAFWIACARISFSGDPALAIVAGYLGFVGLCRVLRAAVELDRPLVRGLLGGLSALVLAWFWTNAYAFGRPSYGVDANLATFQTTGAVATALTALVLGGLVTRLPGLSPLWSRRLA